MKKGITSVCFLSLLAAMPFANPANAEDSNSEAIYALWQPSTQSPAPWIDNRSNDFSTVDPEILATGHSIALIKAVDGHIYVADEQLRPVVPISLPEHVQWLGIDGKDRILIYDGQNLMSSRLDQGTLTDFVTILVLGNVPSIDVGNDYIAFPQDGFIKAIHLENGSMTSTPLVDFFDEEKILAMTPEAVAKAEASPKKKKNKPTATKHDEESGMMQPPEIRGLWMRPDDALVIRIGRMMDVRTFVSIDSGKSWSQLKTSPAELQSDAGWIWDGQGQVLNQKGTGFVNLQGPMLAIPDRLTIDHRRITTQQLPKGWMTMQPAEPTPTLDNSAPASNTVEIPFIPVLKASMKSEELPQTGMRMGLYRNSVCTDGNNSCDSRLSTTPDAWIKRIGEEITALSLPENCDVTYVGGTGGLGLAMCRTEADEVYVFARTADSEWALEGQLPQPFSENFQIMQAVDGTVALTLNDCQTETCQVAVRMPGEAGTGDLWGVDNVSNPIQYNIATGGRVLVVSKNADAPDSLDVYGPSGHETIVSTFDTIRYDGFGFTDDGCLYAVLNDDEHSHVLLSADGIEANMNCELSKQHAEKLILDKEAQQQKKPASSRYGLRVGAGGFLAQQNVRTWFVRVEGILPIYDGKYEVGLMYRMGGGNKGSKPGHMGMISARWRYNDLQYFDFAVGAGIGFGQLTGYKKEEVQEGTETTTEEATVSEEQEKWYGYKRLNTLTLRCMISAMAAYKFSEHWRLYAAVEFIGGTYWGVDLGAGIEVRF